jgi:HNH endonuclease
MTRWWRGSWGCGDVGGHGAISILPSHELPHVGVDGRRADIVPVAGLREGFRFEGGRVTFGSFQRGIHRGRDQRGPAALTLTTSFSSSTSCGPTKADGRSARCASAPSSRPGTSSRIGAGGIAAVVNGLALCAIHHRAFDRNLLGIDPHGVVSIAERLLREIDGLMLRTGLQGFHGEAITMPRRPTDRPDPVRLESRFERFLHAAA